MHAEHRALLDQLIRIGRPDVPGHHNNDSYLGSGHAYHNVSVPARRAIARAWLAEHKAWPAADVLTVVESLFQGDSHEEKTIAALLLGLSAAARGAAGPEDADRWLGHLNGWAEVDSLCQNLFTAQQMLADWPGWRGLIERLAADRNINKRRAALVLLTGPVHYSDNPRFADLAFATTERLKAERDILITKAVSWLLRSMTARHAAAVAAYLDANETSLPRIAIRETRAKLRTGRKSGR